MTSPETRALERELRASRKADRKDQPKRVMHKRVEPAGHGQRAPRERDNGYLAWLRRLPCIAGLIEGGCSGPIQAAHLRYSDFARGRVNPGMGRKPSDKYATALCAGHHLHDQHEGAERAFWSRLGVEPGGLCAALYGAYRADQPGEPIIRLFAGGSRCPSR